MVLSTPVIECTVSLTPIDMGAKVAGDLVGAISLQTDPWFVLARKALTSATWVPAPRGCIAQQEIQFGSLGLNYPDFPKSNLVEGVFNLLYGLLQTTVGCIGKEKNCFWGDV